MSKKEETVKVKIDPKRCNIVKCRKCGWETDLFGGVFTCVQCGATRKVKAVKTKTITS